MENTFIPYVYKVTSLITNQFYFGMKSTPCEIGIDYFTSSNKEFKNDFKSHPENYLCEKVFIGRIDDVVKVESELIKENIDNPLILNKAFNNGHLYISKNNNIRDDVYKKLSESTRKRAKERPWTFPGRNNTECKEETRRKISESLKGNISYNKGKHITEEQKEKQSTAMKGRIPWNKGKTGIYPEDTLQKMGEANKGRVSLNKGKKASLETRQKLSESHKGQTPWNIGKHLSDDERKKLSDAHKGQKAHNLGKKCFNNGVYNVYAYECPEGFVPGQLKKHK